MSSATDARPSNWGRWGADDQRGTLNLLTPDRVAAALTIPRAGKVFTLGGPIAKDGVSTGKRNPTWHVTTQVTDPGDPGRGRAEDMLVMHTHAHTHIDGLAHAWFDHTIYNDFPAAKAVGRGGAKRGSVEHYGGIVGTAAIVDVTAVRELGPGTAVTADDLRAAATRGAVDPAGADVLIIRTGWSEVHTEDPDRFAQGSPGLAPDGALWVAEQDPAVVGMDSTAIEPVPAPEGVDPLACHDLFLHRLGTPLIENLHLAEVAAAGFSSGLFVATPLNIPGGLGSPLNPLLIV